DGPHNFEPQRTTPELTSSPLQNPAPCQREDIWPPASYFESQRATPELPPSPLQTHAPCQREDLWSPTCYFACNRPTYTTDLEPSGPEAQTLPLGHRGLPQRSKSLLKSLPMCL
ncbi:hypothetical protein AVEN_164209-1, partial [Araneus ventricosus]